MVLFRCFYAAFGDQVEESGLGRAGSTMSESSRISAPRIPVFEDFTPTLTVVVTNTLQKKIPRPRLQLIIRIVPSGTITISATEATETIEVAKTTNLCIVESGLRCSVEIQVKFCD